MLCWITVRVEVKNWYRAQSLGSFQRRSTSESNVDDFWTFCKFFFESKANETGEAPLNVTCHPREGIQ